MSRRRSPYNETPCPWEYVFSVILLIPYDDAVPLLGPRYGVISMYDDTYSKFNTPMASASNLPIRRISQSTCSTSILARRISVEPPPAACDGLGLVWGCAQHKNTEGAIPLHNAARHSRLSAVELLIFIWPDGVKVKARFRRIPLHLAVRTAHVDVILALLRAWPQSGLAKDHFHATALHGAVSSTGREDVVNVLLERCPAAARQTDRDHWKPIHLAVKNGSLPLVQLLLHCFPEGAKPRGGDIDETPLHLAARNGETEILECLLRVWPEGSRYRNWYGDTPLHSAINNGHLSATNLLLKRRPDLIHDTTRGGYYPLHLAARMGHRRLVKRLLAVSPVSVQLRTLDGSTPLHVAATAGADSMIPVIDLLLQHWPEAAHAYDDAGLTPIHKAIGVGPDWLTVKLLKPYPHLLHDTTRDGSTVLHLAATSAIHSALVALILSLVPSSAEARNNDGAVPLHVAAANGLLSNVELLLRAWPEGVHVYDVHGCTPLHVAIRCGNVAVVERLKQRCPNTVEGHTTGSSDDNTSTRIINHDTGGGSTNRPYDAPLPSAFDDQATSSGTIGRWVGRCCCCCAS